MNNKNILKVFILILLFVFISLLFMFAVPNLPNTSVLLELRFNKWLTLFLVGGLTGIGSFITQILMNNKKADISMIGVGAFNIIALVLVLSITTIETLLLWKDNALIGIIFISSFIAIIIVWCLSKFIFKSTNYLLIVGLIMTLFASALAYIIIDKMKVHVQEEVSNYLVGSILINDQKYNIQNTIGIVVLLVVVLWLILFGDKFVLAISNPIKAKTLGIAINFHKFFALVCIALVATSSFLMAGNMMFIGFAIGNLNYLIFKKNTRFSSIGVILIGGILTLTSYYLFNRLFNFKTYEGIHIMLGSGIVLLLSILYQRIKQWTTI